MANASISARIGADNSDFKAKLAETDNAAKAWAQRMSQTRQNVSREFSGSMGADPGAGIFTRPTLTRVADGINLLRMAWGVVREMGKSGDALRDLSDGLENVGKDAETTAEQLDALLALSRNPGIAFVEAATASKNLRAMGYTAAESRAIILSLGNALAATGESEEALGTVTEALTKLMDRGELSERAFVALAQTAPKIRDAFKALGAETAQDLAKLGTDTRQIVAAIIGELQKVNAVTPDAADIKRIQGDYLMFQKERAAMLAQDALIGGRDVSDQSGTTSAARGTRISAPPVDAAAVEAARTAKLRALERERDLRLQIERAESSGTTFATALRIELELLQKREALIKSAAISQEEATRFLTENVQLEEARFRMTQSKAAYDKSEADRGQGQTDGTGRRRIRTLDQDPDARNERRFNRSRDLRRQFRNYEEYVNRDPEQGSLGVEQQRNMRRSGGLADFEKFKNDREWGRVPLPAEREKKAHSDRIEKEKGAGSPELKALEAAAKALQDVAKSLAGQRDTKGDPKPRVY